jgi:hypothetical protein
MKEQNKLMLLRRKLVEEDTDIIYKRLIEIEISL